MVYRSPVPHACKEMFNNDSHKVKPYVTFTMDIKVVLPAPLGPSIPKHSPDGNARDNPFTATFSGLPSLPGYIFLRLSEMIA